VRRAAHELLGGKLQDALGGGVKTAASRCRCFPLYQYAAFNTAAQGFFGDAM
jgi:hypothetical protein